MSTVTIRPGRPTAVAAVLPGAPEGFFITAVAVDLVARSWTLRLAGTVRPAPEELQALSAQVLALPGGPAAVEFTFEPLAAADDWWEPALAELRQRHPATAGLLGACRVEVEPQRLIIGAASELTGAALRRPATVEALRQVSARHAGRQIQVAVEVCPGGLDEAALTAAPVPPARRPRARRAPAALTPLARLAVGPGTVCVEGQVFRTDRRPLRGGGTMTVLALTDFTDSVLVKHRCRRPGCCQFGVGDWVQVSGTVVLDGFEEEPVVNARSITRSAARGRHDDSAVKRVELHLHTKMSAMDAVCDLEELFATLERWGHDAVAITDHGVVQAFPAAFELAQRHKVKLILGLEAYLVEDAAEQARPFHATVLVTNATGLSNLYQLVSASHLRHFYRVPRLPRGLLERHREGLLLGTGCQAGELYTALLDGADDATLEAIAGWYDFVELQPVENNAFLVESGRVADPGALAEANRRLYRVAERLRRPVVATGDVHYLEPYDERVRRILLSGQGYADAEHHAPLHLHTTAEMLELMAHLGAEAAYAAVVDNPRRLVAEVEPLRPVPEGLFPPELPEAAAAVRRQVFLAAHARYGTPLPTLVQERLDWELEAIIGHGFAGIFHIAAQLVARSRAHGYLVGSRGSVGSSLVATLCGITEVNPLPPHYFCVRCRYVEFESDGRAGSGFDLPARSCPGCGGELVRDGQDIAFETFMGFHGEKVPDIDLNFSGECQAEIHRYAEELLGKHQVFRAGTIATLADKTAYGFVRHFNEENAAGWRRAEIDRLTAALTGVKRTTGQHPGGLMIVPAGRSMSEFSPVQFPADDRRSGTVTTHFAYEAIHDHLVKLDLLGHDDPTSLRLLQDLTGVDPLAIPFDDRDTLAIFSGLRPLGLDPADWEPPVGTVGIPEFGTRFVRRILTDTRPRTFSELVRVSGLSHGTDVWLNNAQELIAAKVADISQVISSRDDITIYLVHRGLPPVVAFRISESVRRGRGVSEGDAEAMAEAGVPDWFIASCQKIKYLFPKAHASAYVMMAFRIAYFKVHHPAAFYAAYFTTRAGNIDAGLLLAPEEWRSRLQHAGARNSDLSQREQDQAVHLEVALEMRARGIGFLAPDLYRSDATRFGLEGGGLRLPLSTLPGFGQAAATRVVAARAHGPFLSVEDLRLRCRLPRNLIELLSTFGCTRDLPDKNQIGLF